MRMRVGWWVVALAVWLAPALALAKQPIALGAVELNSASLHDLMQLPGVGKKRAEEILRHRAERPFRRAVELLGIKGIGRRTFLRLKQYVRVDTQAMPRAGP